MKLKREFAARAIGGGGEAMSPGVSAFGAMVRSDETAAFVAGCLERETTPETIIAAMYAECDAPIGVVAADVERMLGVLRRMDALDE